MDLSIVIVSWNTKELLKKCLTSIYHNQGDLKLEVLVVDNNSGDQTVDMIKTDFPQVTLIANQVNLGFATGNNQAIKRAKGEYILLLNPDTEIIDSALQKSVNFFKETKGVGILGCQILNPDKTIQPSVRRFPTWFPLFLIFLKLPKLFPHLKAVEHYLATDFNYAQNQIVAQVMGAFMLTKKTILDQIGLLDESFFIWFEEVDLCRRAQQNGYRVYYFKDAQIIHSGGQSFAQAATITNQVRFFKSAWHYLKKHGFTLKSDRNHK